MMRESNVQIVTRFFHEKNICQDIELPHIQAQAQISNVTYVTSLLPINATWISTKMECMLGPITSARSAQQLMPEKKSCRNTLKMESTWWSSIVEFVTKNWFSKICKPWKSTSRLRLVVGAKDMESKYGVLHHRGIGTYMETKVWKNKKKNSSKVG